MHLHLMMACYWKAPESSSLLPWDSPSCMTSMKNMLASSSARSWQELSSTGLALTVTSRTTSYGTPLASCYCITILQSSWSTLTFPKDTSKTDHRLHGHGMARKFHHQQLLQISFPFDVTSTTTNAVIYHLTELFALEGNSKEVLTDNG